MSQNEIFLEIGARIKELRGEMSQDAFAKRLNVARKTVVRWEAGTGVPDGVSILDLLLEFGAEPTWLLTGKRPHPGTMGLNHREIALLSNYEASDEAGKKIIEGTATLATQSAQAKQLAAAPVKPKKKAA